MIDYEALRPFATTDRQVELIDAVLRYGGMNAAERALGLSGGLISRSMTRLRARKADMERRAAIAPRGTPGFVPRELTTAYSPEGEPTGSWVREGPDPIMEPGGEDAGPARDGGGPYIIKGVSTYFGADGSQRGQWVKTRLDDELREEMMREQARAFMEGLGQVEIPPFLHQDVQSDVIPWIQIGDAHIGMLAHEAEAGADFNVEIAQREICAAFKLLIDQLEPCERIVINDLGDRDHFENTEKVTSHSRHPLDGQRPRLMIRTSSKVMRFVIDLALTKARYVDVIGNQGNHSRFGDLWMNELLEVAYGASDRVNIIDNENVFIGYRMGKTLVMTHHSDKCPFDRLAGVMMSDFKQDFAETEFHYIDVGHIHHKMTVKERDGIVIESWNTLARGDKWHKENGYRARQSMSVVFRSRTYGEVGRRTVPIQMVYDAIRRGHDASGLRFIPVDRRAFAV